MEHEDAGTLGGLPDRVEGHDGPCLIIRRIALAHCKRGPENCEACRKMADGRICLLDICPSDLGRMQRRVIEVEVDGESVWREYDMVRAFENEAEARAFAREKGIADVEI
jgi:hypothetical protein